MKITLDISEGALNRIRNVYNIRMMADVNCGILEEVVGKMLRATEGGGGDETVVIKLKEEKDEQ